MSEGRIGQAAAPPPSSPGSWARSSRIAFHLLSDFLLLLSPGFQVAVMKRLGPVRWWCLLSACLLASGSLAGCHGLCRLWSIFSGR